MAEFRCINTSSLFSLMTLMLQLTAAALENCHLFGREGGAVSLSCGAMKHDHDECNRTTWIFSDGGDTATATLFEFGKIHKDAKNKSGRLSVTADCSLEIKTFTAEDVGHYTCRKFNKSHQQEGSDTTADLCLVKMTEQKDNSTVTLTCSVVKHNGCPYTVNWLYEENDSDKNNNDLMTSQSTCSANVTFSASHYVYTSKNYELFKCKVMNDETVKEFIFRIGMKTGWRKFITVAVVLSALLITAVTVVIQKRTKQNKTQMRENNEVNLNPDVPQPASTAIKHSADPEDTVSYALISFTRKTRSKATVLGKQYEPVIYSTVKASSSS